MKLALEDSDTDDLKDQEDTECTGLSRQNIKSMEATNLTDGNCFAIIKPNDIGKRKFT